VDATVQDIPVESLKLRRRVVPWFGAFVIQTTLLFVVSTVTNLLVYGPSVAFSPVNLIEDLRDIIIVVALFWTLGLLLERAIPGFFRKLIPRSVDKYLLLSGSRASEIEELLLKRAKVKREDLSVADAWVRQPRSSGLTRADTRYQISRKVGIKRVHRLVVGGINTETNEAVRPHKDRSAVGDAG
jgi:hypothetical protein